MVRRHLVGNSRILNLALGPHQPLRQGCLRDEKSARDFAGRESAKRPQGQRNLRLAIERRVTAGENETQPVIGYFGGRRLWHDRLLARLDCEFVLQKTLFFPPPTLAPPRVDQLAI